MSKREGLPYDCPFPLDYNTVGLYTWMDHNDYDWEAELIKGGAPIPLDEYEIVYAYMGGLTYKQVAEKLNVPVGRVGETVRSVFYLLENIARFGTCAGAWVERIDEETARKLGLR